jgi:hypothetical protein
MVYKFKPAQAKRGVGHLRVPAVRCQLLTMENRVQSQISPRRSCDEQSNNEADVSQSTLLFSLRICPIDMDK